MMSQDWRTISSAGYVFGLLFLIVGIYVYFYYYTNWIGWLGLTFYQYRSYYFSMIIIGVALMSIGFFLGNILNGKLQKKKTATYSTSREKSLLVGKYSDSPKKESTE